MGLEYKPINYTASVTNAHPYPELLGGKQHLNGRSGDFYIYLKSEVTEHLEKALEERLSL